MHLTDKISLSARVPAAAARKATAIVLVVETRHPLPWCCCLVRKRSTPLLEAFLEDEWRRSTSGAVAEFCVRSFKLNTQMMQHLGGHCSVKMKVKNRSKTILKSFVDARDLLRHLHNHANYKKLHVTLNASHTHAASTVEVRVEKHEPAAPAPVKRERRPRATKTQANVNNEGSSGRQSKKSRVLKRRQQGGDSITPQYLQYQAPQPGQYEVRVIVWGVAHLSKLTAMEFFPDICFKAKMCNPRGEWRRTDVHDSCVKGEAFFNYRMILPRFTYPPPPRKVGLLALRKTTLPPTLTLAMMDCNPHVPDIYMGKVELNLEDTCLPDDLEVCGKNTLYNKHVNLFDASAVEPHRHSEAVFPRELTGYWPVLKRSKLNLKLRRSQTGSVLMTVQLLTAQEAAEFPAVQGNRSHPLNCFPTLLKPKREHGRFMDLVCFARIKTIEQVVHHVFHIPSLKVAFWLSVVVGYVVYNVYDMEPEERKALVPLAVPAASVVCVLISVYKMLTLVRHKLSVRPPERPQDSSSSSSRPPPPQETRGHIKATGLRGRTHDDHSEQAPQPVNTHKCERFLRCLRCKQCRSILSDKLCVAFVFVLCLAILALPRLPEEWTLPVEEAVERLLNIPSLRMAFWHTVIYLSQISPYVLSGAALVLLVCAVMTGYKVITWLLRKLSGPPGPPGPHGPPPQETRGHHTKATGHRPTTHKSEQQAPQPVSSQVKHLPERRFPTEGRRPSEPAGGGRGSTSSWWLTFLRVVFVSSVFFFAVLSLPRLPKKWTSSTATRPPLPRALKDATEYISPPADHGRGLTWTTGPQDAASLPGQPADPWSRSLRGNTEVPGRGCEGAFSSTEPRQETRDSEEKEEN